MRRTLPTVVIGATVLLLGDLLTSVVAGQGRGGASPASKAPPATVKPQTYPAAQIEAGQTRFAAKCGFCHGRDAGGGESGPDLTRSALVAETCAATSSVR